MTALPNLPKYSKEQADQKGLLSQWMLQKMHLVANGKPRGYGIDEQNQIVLYYAATDVKEAPVEKKLLTDEFAGKTYHLGEGKDLPMMSIRRASSLKFYSKETLDAMGYDVVAEPVGAFLSKKHNLTLFYDKSAAIPRPKLCSKCKNDVVFRNKLCFDCYDKSLEEERMALDAELQKPYHQHRDKTIFFDLELTGVYSYDEILSVSIMDGNGKMLMNTLVKPHKRKRWKETEKIHGITPEMVENAPYLEEIQDEIKKIFDGAEALLAYGILTDYSHIQWIYPTAQERKALWGKCKCIYQSFVKYQRMHYPRNTKCSLTDAMALFGIEWEGTAHNSDADTLGCLRVWDKLYPNYYDEEMSE